MHTRILAAPGQIDFSVIAESLDLCPGCNWDEAWLSRPWMWLNAPFILLLFCVFPFYHAVLGLCHTLSACPVPLPLLDFLSASASSHKQAFFWLDVWITQPHSRLSCSFFLPPSRLNFYHLSVLTWRTAVRAGGGNRRGWWEIGRPKVKQAIFGKGLIV